MKFIFAAEDTIIGIICGLLLIGYTEKYFSLKLGGITYAIIFLIYTFFILLDIVNEVKDLTTHFGFIVFSILHSLADLAIALAVSSHFSGFNIPYITALIVPYLASQDMMFFTGAFLLIGNVIWLILYPFLD